GAAEEVVQDVFTRAWRHAGEWDPERASVRTWLYGIARNAIVDHERRRGRRPRADGHGRAHRAGRPALAGRARAEPSAPRAPRDRRARAPAGPERARD